jgi:hypothetical protein
MRKMTRQTQIKFFTGKNLTNLQDLVNEFIWDRDVIEIQYRAETNDQYPTAMVLFSP